jgi:hypothetical protein
VGSCFENKPDFLGDRGEYPELSLLLWAPFRGPESLKRVAWLMREKYLFVDQRSRNGSKAGKSSFKSRYNVWLNGKHSVIPD